MTTITLKGYEFNALEARDSFNRRTIQYKNNIITILKKIGIANDDVYIDLEPMVQRNLPASATWYIDGYRLYYSYKSAKKYVNNLYVVYKLIELEVADLLAERKTFEEFLSDFTEKSDVEQTRKEAREMLGISHDVLDMAIIDSKYKQLAKRYHPDVDGGDLEMFKKINNAHLILKRELS